MREVEVIKCIMVFKKMNKMPFTKLSMRELTYTSVLSHSQHSKDLACV